jgi:antirestriction protein ArdC
MGIHANIAIRILRHLGTDHTCSNSHQEGLFKSLVSRARYHASKFLIFLAADSLSYEWSMGHKALACAQAFSKDRRGIVERILHQMPDKPKIVHALVEDAGYNLFLDVVVMPHMGMFKDQNWYYAVLFHELVHSTGHPHRLNRFGDVSEAGCEQVFFEELVAEFGCGFLRALTHVSSPKMAALRAAHLENYIRELPKHAALSLTAQAVLAAQHAVHYIVGSGGSP